ncbi:hypothetical protein [Pedobacter sp. Leaf194]|nr:hypothetical protein [Pedobacter sp. Leaf194]
MATNLFFETRQSQVARSEERARLQAIAGLPAAINTGVFISKH